MGFMFHKQRNGHQSCISVMSHDNPCPRTLITLCQIPKALWRTLFRYVPHAFDSTNRRVFCWYSWKLKKKLNKRPKGTRKRGHEELQTTPVNKGPDLGFSILINFNSIPQIVCHPSRIDSCNLWRARARPPKIGSGRSHPITSLLIISEASSPALDFGKPPWDFHLPWPPNHRITM